MHSSMQDADISKLPPIIKIRPVTHRTDRSGFDTFFGGTAAHREEFMGKVHVNVLNFLSFDLPSLTRCLELEMLGVLLE